MRYIFAGVAVVCLLVASIGFGIVNATHIQSRVCHVTSKDRAYVSDGKGGGHSDQRVYTTDCGVLHVSDSVLSWHFNSADTYESIHPGQTYRVTTRGFRIPFLSMFPNVVDAQQVTP